MCIKSDVSGLMRPWKSYKYNNERTNTRQGRVQIIFLPFTTLQNKVAQAKFVCAALGAYLTDARGHPTVFK
jgi:hypothetical protein